MDNVTHSLAGLLLAESAVRLWTHRRGAEPSPQFRAVAPVASLIAANLPDADLFYTGGGGDHLAYMLQHRGYTHTILVAIGGAVLLWCAAWLGWRWREPGSPPPSEARWLFGLILVSALSHLGLDWTNSYGIHPFWPWDNRWRYGDAVFIVEPWFWVVSIPVLVAASNSRLMRGLLSAILVIALVLAWRVDVVATSAAAALTVGAVLIVVLARTLAPGKRVGVSVAGWIVVTLIMATGSARIRATTLVATRAVDPAAQMLDVVVTPLPANPVCMTVITVEREAETYRVATARVSALPSVIQAASCGSRGGRFERSTRPSTAAIHWESEWTAPRAELVSLSRESCLARAALRFIRVPIWRPLNDSSVMLGDARYGGASGGGFSDVSVPRRTAACPHAVPPWTPPRADLLSN